MVCPYAAGMGTRPGMGPERGSRRPGQAFRPDVQGLRAVAVGLVVLGHAHIPGFAGGFVGVDVFFVISGFLITGVLLGDTAAGKVSFARFYSRRALRILPAASLVILATAIASLLALNPLRGKAVLLDSVWASLFAANVKFGRDGTDYFSDAAVSPLQHFWSLAVEEQFYLVWPALLAVTVFGLPALLTRLGRTRRPSAPAPVPRVRIAVLLVVVGLLSLMASVRETAVQATSAYFSTVDRAWELIAGALLAVCLPLLGRLPEAVRSVLTWGGIAGVTVAAVMFSSLTPYPGSAALVPVLAACAVLVGGIGAPRWGANHLLGRRPMRFVGDISYSLYLWHWPLLILAAAYAGHELGKRQALMVVGLAVLLSVASYRWVENPLRHSRRRWAGTPSGPLLLWPVTVGAVVLLAVVGQSTGPAADTAEPGVYTAGSGDATTAASDPTPGPEAAGPGEVAASALAAEAADPIPADLQPPIDHILRDRTDIGDCSGYLKTQSQICQYGDPHGSKRIVLFGNSHAVAWLPAVQQLAKAAGWQLFPVVKEACDYPLYLSGDPNNQCTAWYQWATQQIAALHPDLIVLNGYNADDGWQSALQQVTQALKALGKQELMLSDPAGATAPFDCLQQRNATLRTCLSPDPQDKIDASHTEQQIAAAAGIDFVNVDSWFCYQNECPSVIGNRVVYADLGHVSITYSKHLAPLLDPQLHLQTR